MATTMIGDSDKRRKLKVLLFGAVQEGEEWSTFQKKLVALHQSKSGPFDVAFVVGPCHGNFAKSSSDNHCISLKLPIPVYLQEGWNPTSPSPISSGGSSHESNNDNGDSLPEGIVTLAPNLFWLRGNSELDQEPSANIWRLPIKIQQQEHHLVVAACPRLFRTTTSDGEKFLSLLRHPSFVGCDVLLTNEGPQGIEETLTQPSTSLSNWLTSYDIAQVALLARARYHVTASCYRSGDQISFCQSHPFAHLPSLSSTRPILHTGRFLNLAPVSKKQSKQDKVNKKFVHALGVIPLHEMNSLDWQEQQPTQPMLRCPFTDVSYEQDATVSSSTAKTSVGLSEAQTRRLIANYSQPDQTRWALNSRKRKQQDLEVSDDTDAVDSSCTTLFVHGMHLDVSGQLQRTDSITLLQAFAKYQALRVRRPQGASTTSFAFVDFTTHEQALKCLQDHPLGEMVVQGVTLTLKWAKRHQRADPTDCDRCSTAPRKVLLTEQEARDSSTLYFRFLDQLHILQMEDVKSTDDETSTKVLITTACEILRKFMERTLEKALIGDDNTDEESGDSEAVTAATEPALQVTLGRVHCKSTKGSTSAAATPQKLDAERDNYGDDFHEEKESSQSRTDSYWYGFLQFASHAAASMALASLTGSVQGGRFQPKQLLLSKLAQPADDDDDIHKASLRLIQGGLILHWALDGAGNNSRQQSVDPWAGLGLQRRHFPPDARTDCWFCLASPTCERHLIVGVYHDWYLTIPKGPVYPGHVLLVPVAHSNRGAGRLSNSSLLEFEDLLERLRRHAQNVYDRKLFVFERAFQTKGGYHTHVQCIPVESAIGTRLQTTLLAASARLGINLRELSSDVQLATIVSSSNEDDRDDMGYFYAEVPTSGNIFHRFLYTAMSRSVESDQHQHRPSTVSVIPPVQFGREALAAVLNQPDLAHWKACIVDEEKETEIAKAFRQSFAEYAPSASSKSRTSEE